MVMTQKEKLIEILARDMCDSYEHGCDGTRCFDDWCMVGVKADRLIASDVVPVVRCKDCRSAHKGGSGYIWCKGVPHPLDWFCADGKPNDVEESYTCGSTGLPCIKCNPGGCNSRRKDGYE